MVYLEIDKKDHDEMDKIDVINKTLKNKKSKLFLLIYMEGCGPCNQTRPEWYKLKNVLSSELLNKNDIVIAAINKDLFDELNIKNKPSSFPDIRFITNGGATEEDYEKSDISNKDRTIDSFVEWIKQKTNRENVSNEEVRMAGGRKTKHHIHKKHGQKSRSRNRKTKRWTRKYKRRINCRRPRGFSQRQYCKTKLKRRH